jgi:SAM-dependent methyltransferase
MPESTEIANSRSNWFESFFHGVANDCWRRCVTPEQTSAEVDFVERKLNGKILDVPCGNGRHSLELARRGREVTGVDLSSEFIAEASAAAKEASLRAQFLKMDMRELKFEREFDGALCMGNSFGYMEFEGMRRFVHGIARALKPGGRFIIETGATAESLLPHLKERSWYQIQDILFAIEHHYDAESSCLETRGTFARDGRTEVRRWWHWIYTVGEIKRLLGEFGLTAREFHGSLADEPYKLGSPRLFLVAENGAGTEPGS